MGNNFIKVNLFHAAIDTDRGDTGHLMNPW